MKWEGREESKNVEDRRRLGKTAAIGGGIGGLLILVVGMLLGVNPQKLMNAVGQPGAPQAQQPVNPAEEKLASFSKTIFGDTERIWTELFASMGKKYSEPTLVLFSGSVQSACGFANAAVGPFYCPRDAKVYLDMAFYADMQKQLNAPGEFARAYVIAHEVGHHVQNLLGYSQRVDEVRARFGNGVEANRASVRLELQADFLAGVWAHHAQKKYNFLEPGDVETALNCAFQIGDDRLQKNAQGYVVPDSFTHGTSQQRLKWFREGLRTGDLRGASQLFDLRYEEL